MSTDTQVHEFPMPREHPLDPPPRYRELTARRPVVQVRTPRGHLAWLVTRHEDVRAVLNDRRFSSDPRTPGFPTYLTGDLEPPAGFFMQFDDPDHSRLRRFVSREFVISRIEALRPGMQALLDRLIDEMVRRADSAELIQQLALPMASITICELLGVPPEDSVLVKNHVDVLLDRSSTPEAATHAAIVLAEYFDRLVTSKERSSSDDLLGRLVTAASGGELSHQELIGMATLLLLGGYDTMVQMIGLGVLALLEHPDQLQQLRRDDALVPGAVEELLRYLTVNHAGLPRAALEDVTVGGQPIRAGDGVLVMVNAANRDEAVFADPDVLDIRRQGPLHMAFGHGLHKCIGVALARTELETVFSGLFRRLPSLRVTAAIRSLEFRHDMVLYGVRELPVSW